MLDEKSSANLTALGTIEILSLVYGLPNLLVDQICETTL